MAQQPYRVSRPQWNQNPRAMANVHIPREQPACTLDLRKYIDEPFETTAQLYFFLDYTIAIQVVERQTVCFTFADARCRVPVLVVLSVELHRHDEPLFAVIVPNDRARVKQKWRIIPYEPGRICDAFMTRDALCRRFGISANDILSGARAKHSGFAPVLADITRAVSRRRIAATHWEHVRVIQCKKIRKGAELRRMRISAERFRELVLRAWQKHRGDMTGAVQFKLRRNAYSQYEIHGALVVELPEFAYSVVVSFGVAGDARAICLDLHDIKNKANLARVLRDDASLSVACANMQRKTKQGEVVYDLVIEGDKSKSRPISTRTSTRTGARRQPPPLTHAQRPPITVDLYETPRAPEAPCPINHQEQVLRHLRRRPLPAVPPQRQQLSLHNIAPQARLSPYVQPHAQCLLSLQPQLSLPAPLLSMRPIQLVSPTATTQLQLVLVPVATPP